MIVLGISPKKFGVALYTISFFVSQKKMPFQLLTQKKTNMNNLINTSKAIAFLSFVIGTILFALKLSIITSLSFIYFGMIFIIVATIVNTISLIALIFLICGYTDQRLELIKTCGIILLNIPIALLYFYILIEFL